MRDRGTGGANRQNPAWQHEKNHRQRASYWPPTPAADPLQREPVVWQRLVGHQEWLPETGAHRQDTLKPGLRGAPSKAP